MGLTEERMMTTREEAKKTLKEWIDPDVRRRAFAAFSIWVDEHDPDGEMNLLEQILRWETSKEADANG
jgi:hypothetical protein